MAQNFLEPHKVTEILYKYTQANGTLTSIKINSIKPILYKKFFVFTI